MGRFRLKYRLPKNSGSAESSLMKEGVVAYLDALGTKGVWARLARLH